MYMPYLVEPCWESEVILVSTLLRKTQINISYLSWSSERKKMHMTVQWILGNIFPCSNFVHVFDPCEVTLHIHLYALVQNLFSPIFYSLVSSFAELISSSFKTHRSFAQYYPQTIQ